MSEEILHFIDNNGIPFDILSSHFDDLEIGKYLVITDLVEEGDRKYTKTRQFTRDKDGIVRFVN